MSTAVRVAIVGILAAMVSSAAPATPPPTVAFSFNVSATEPPVLDSMGAYPNPPNYAGTCAALGACQAFWAYDNAVGAGSSITFTVANGASITATLGQPTFTSGTSFNVPATILGGTGIFTNATGSFQLTQTITNPTPANNVVTTTLTGSGTIIEAAGGSVTELPSKLQLLSPKGSSMPVSQSLALSNTGSTAEPFTASASVTSKTSWLSISSSKGTVAAGGGASIQVTADPSGLAPGVYNGEVDLDISGGAVVVPVLFVVGNSGGNLQLYQTGASFVAAFGGPSPAAQTIDVLNTGIGTLSGLTAETMVTGSGANWLHATIATGFESQTQTTVTITVDPGSLPVGMHYGQVNFDLPNTLNAPQSVSVQMQVQPAPPPTFQPASVLFQGTTNADGSIGPIPPTTFVTITNPGLATLDYTVTVPSSIVDAGTWSPTVTSGSVPAGGTGQLAISISASCWGNPNCIDGPLPIPIWGAWNVNFPAINYTYQLWASIQITGGSSSSPPIPAWGSPPPGLNCAACLGSHDRVSSSGAGRPAIDSSSTPAVCTPSVLDGMITSQSLSGFQTTVGQPTPLQVTIFDNCGNNLNSGTVVASFSNGDPEVALNPLGAGQWSATWVPSNASASATMTLQGVSENGLFGSGMLSGPVAASTATPLIDSGGIANAASGVPVIAPGAFISIYGANMAGGLTVASSTPFPISLGKTESVLGGQSLPLYFTSTKQINAIVPYDIAPNSSQQLIIQTGDALSQPEPVTVAAAQPGVFTQNQSGSGPGAILGQKPGKVAALNTAANPASAGDALLIFCTGLGTVTPAVAAGAAASTTVLSKTDNPVTVTVGGDNAQVLFAGLAPGFVGLYQVNVIVPSGIAAADDVPVVLTEAGATSAPVTVAIH
jgi:trimeric autotransporter adhesin